MLCRACIFTNKMLHLLIWLLQISSFFINAFDLLLDHSPWAHVQILRMHDHPPHKNTFSTRKIPLRIKYLLYVYTYIQVHDGSDMCAPEEIKTNIVYISNKFPRLRPMNHMRVADPAATRHRRYTQMFSTALWKCNFSLV